MVNKSGKTVFILLFFFNHFLLASTSVLLCVNRFLGANFYYINTQYDLYFLSLVFVITPICFFVNQIKQKNVIFIGSLIFFIEFFLLFCFSTKNVFIFYIFFEAVLIPLYLIIGTEGVGYRKIKAAYYLFIYTLLGSFFMLFALIYIYFISNNFYYVYLETTNFSFCQQNLICFCFILAFLVKIPAIPFHLWLPEAHVEAPTIGSILLASLILKIPGFGLINLVLNLYPYGCCFHKSVVQLISCLSIIYASLSAAVQIDIKKIIAYSSISHMNLIILGLFSDNQLGTWGSLYLMMGHAFVSSGLFFCAGLFYSRTHTKILYYYGGTVQLMPITCVFFFFFSIANMSFPGTCNFVGEIALLSDLYFSNKNVLFISSTTVFFSAVYSMLLYNKISFGVLNTNYIFLYVDAFREEIFVLSVFLLFVFSSGLFSFFLL